MTPFEIVMVACLSANPAQCQEHRVPYESPGSLKSCVYDAQGAVAHWIGDHPKYVIKSYSCEISGVKQSANG